MTEALQFSATWGHGLGAPWSGSLIIIALVLLYLALRRKK
jgi:hypothetical protein